MPDSRRAKRQANRGHCAVFQVGGSSEVDRTSGRRRCVGEQPIPGAREAHEPGASPAAPRGNEGAWKLIVNRAAWPEDSVGTTRVRFVWVDELAGAVEDFLSTESVPPSTWTSLS